MRQVGDHGLTCLEETDYAAYALAMQCNAEALDVALSVDRQALNAYLDRPWISYTNTGSVVVNSASGTTGPGNIVGASLRPSTSASVAVTANGIPTAYQSADPATKWPTGIYLVGASIAWTLAAATAESIRQLLVYGLRDDGGVVNTISTSFDLYVNDDYQGDGGNNGALNVVGMLEVGADFATMESFFSHANVAGDLTIAAGAWKVWATYLGSGLVI